MFNPEDGRGFTSLARPQAFSAAALWSSAEAPSAASARRAGEYDFTSLRSSRSHTCPSHTLQILCVLQEFDRKILARLLSEEQDGRRTESQRRGRVVADAAWMKRVIEEQLQLEREREAEFDTLHR